MTQVRYFGIVLMLLFVMADGPTCADMQSFLPSLPKLSDNASTPGEKQAAAISDEANASLNAANLEDLALTTHDPAQLDQAQEAYKARARKNNELSPGIPRYDYEKHALYVAKGDNNGARTALEEGDHRLESAGNFASGEMFNVMSGWQLVWALREVRDSYQSNKKSPEYQNLTFAYCAQLKKFQAAVDALTSSPQSAKKGMPGYYLNKGYFSSSGC